MYTLVKGVGQPFIRRDDDGAFIPLDDDNRLYQEYLAWVADGNVAPPYVPETPDEPSDTSSTSTLK